jgi:hypothetical protein
MATSKGCKEICGPFFIPPLSARHIDPRSLPDGPGSFGSLGGWLQNPAYIISGTHPGVVFCRCAVNE